MKTPRRIVQWTTGNVGVKSVQVVVANSTMELVGCYAWSPGKVGKDVGDLCGIDPIGLRATDDVAALLPLKPDCVVPVRGAAAGLGEVLGLGQRDFQDGQL